MQILTLGNKASWLTLAPESRHDSLILTPGLNQYFSKLNLPPSHVRITWAPRLTHRIRIAGCEAPGTCIICPLSGQRHWKFQGCSGPSPSHLHPSVPEAAGTSPGPPSLFSVKPRQVGQYHFPASWPACNTCYSDFTCSGWMHQWQKQERNPCGRGPEYRGTACRFLLTACLVTRKRPSRGYERM